ncbi:helix-turn-helix domain-containing protein [Klebsiella oxytoca]|uniref:helix-turn-helix domain-containing protein n=1 Tax=Klebsiella oxytoca TaxID=571 RepID=UPI000940DDDF|nr:helix-turn-helix transcriptional regulator [Klebsiella oxytoca]
MNFDSLCATRLKSERARLKLSQIQVSGLCGVSREMWGKYERGAAVPGGDVLASFANNGGDIQYVLTGNRSNSLSLARDEMEMLEFYRAAPLQVRMAALAALTSVQTEGVRVSGRNNRVAGHDYHEGKK